MQAAFLFAKRTSALANILHNPLIAGAAKQEDSEQEEEEEEEEPTAEEEKETFLDDTLKCAMCMELCERPVTVSYGLLSFDR